MKTRTVWILIISNLILLIVLWPWWELFLGFVAALLFIVFLHYWVDKQKYGPYLYYGSDVSSKITVNWIGVDEKYHGAVEETMLELSKSQDFSGTGLKSYGCTKVDFLNGRCYYHYECSELSAETTYFYRIRFRGKYVFEGTQFHFTTGPPNSKMLDSDQSPKIIVYGDDQTADWIPVMAQTHNHFMYKEDPDIIVHLGDINQRIFRKGENNSFWMTKRKLFRTVPYMPVIGNHDYPIVEYPPPDDAWKFWDSFYNMEHHYSFDYGRQLMFICINCEASLEPNTNGQYEFIENELKRSVEENRFAVICGHVAPYNIQTHVNPKQPRIENVKENLAPLLRKYNRGLQRNIVYFAGHMHTYERIIKDDVTYMTVGACSNAKWYSKLEPNEKDELRVHDTETEYGGRAFALLTIDDDTLHVTIRKMFGKDLEHLLFSL